MPFMDFLLQAKRERLNRALDISQQEISQRKDRLNLETTVHQVEMGRQLGGSLGDLLINESLGKMGFNKDEVKALQKSDDEQFAETFKPALEHILKQNPEMGLEGAKTLLKNMPLPQKVKTLQDAAQAANDEKVANAGQQLGQSQQQQPAAPTNYAMAVDSRLAFLQNRLTAIEQLTDVPAAAKQKERSAIQSEMNSLIALRNQERLATQATRSADQFQQSQAGIASRFEQSLAERPLAAARARREEQQNAPLDVNATRWIHPDTLQTASPDMTPVEAKAAGYSVVTPALSQAVPSARTALKTLDRFKELSDKLLVSTKGMNDAAAITRIRANQAALKAKEFAGDPDVQEFIALGATLPTQVKAFGDTGNIAVKETEFAGKSLPNFGTDSKESAGRKVSSRKSLLQQVLKSSLSTASRTVQAQESSGGTPRGPTTAEEYLKKFNTK